MPPPAAWGTTHVQPAGDGTWPERLVNAFTGAEVDARQGWRLSELLAAFPLALLSSDGVAEE